MQGVNAGLRGELPAIGSIPERLSDMKWKGRVRRIAERVYDGAFVLKASPGLRDCAVILHGASCSGKSHVLRSFKRRYKDCFYLETDRLQYWKHEADPGILAEVDAELKEREIDPALAGDLVHSIRCSHRVADKNTRHGTMVELVRSSLAQNVVFATCGNLPPPDIDNGFYDLLGKCVNKTIVHVLVAPDAHVLEQRIRARNLQHNREWILNSNRKRLENRAYYDLVLEGEESAGVMLDMIKAGILRKASLHRVAADTQCDLGQPQ